MSKLDLYGHAESPELLKDDRLNDEEEAVRGRISIGWVDDAVDDILLTDEIVDVGDVKNMIVVVAR